MSYGTKYNITWTDRLSQPCELRIEKLNYSDSSSYIKCAGNPVTIEYDTPSDFALDPINGSKLTMRLIAETDYQFLELYTCNNREYRISFYISSSLYWRGFILTEQYQEAYKGPPYICQFIASDQLGYLKTLAWSNTSILSELDAFNIIFGATDLELDLYEGINVYEDNHNSTAADSPLNQTYFDATNFSEDTYYDVLYHILFKYGAILKQRSGEWNIFRPRESFQEYIVRKWTWGGVGSFSYDLNTTYDPVVLTTSAPPDTAITSMVRIANNGTMFISPAWKNFILFHERSLAETVNANHDFTQWSGSLPEGWQKTGSPIFGRRGNKLRIYGSGTSSNFYHQFYADAPSGAINQVFRIRIEYDVYIPANYDLDLYFNFRKVPSTYYDPDTQAWVTGTIKYIYKYHQASATKFLQEHGELEFTTPDIAISGDYEIRIHTPQGSSPDSYVEYDVVSIEILDSVSSTEVKEYDSKIDHSDDIDLSNNYTPPDFTLKLADGPAANFPNAGNIFNGVLFLDGAKAANTFNWSASGRSGTLIELMKAEFGDFFQYSQQVLSVTIYSKLIDCCSIIQEINNSDRMFMIKRATYDPRFNRWQVEMFQLRFAMAGTDEKVLISEGDVGEKLIVTEGDVGLKRIIVQ